ncbi:MAG: long-chain fatty acid--CoA ligase [Promethearchaeota archaeon]|nr:MAG: long-chain fatty acid--CoA ligase [Candidatus Lokiarchaeota archaeon]
MELPDYIKNRSWKDYLADGITTELDVPENMSLIDVYKYNDENFPDHVMLDFFGKEFTTKELDVLTRRFAAALKDLGLKKGEILALWLPNCPQFSITYFAAVYLGATLTAISPLFTGRELAYQINDSGAKYLIMIDRFVREYEKVADKVSLSKIIILNVMDEEIVVPETDKIIHYDKLLDRYQEPLEFNAEIDSKKDIAIIQYTGGTTGLPKGALLSHYNIVSMLWAIKQGSDYMIENYLKENIIALSVLPWYHIYGQACELLAGCLFGSKAYVLPTFDLQRIAEVIREGRPNMILGVPTMFVNILNSPHMKDVDMSCLKFANCGAGALPDELALEWERRTGFRMAEGYGLSETSTGAITATVWSKLKRGSVGHPFPNTLVGIVNENLEFLPLGEEGEVVISGPQVMVGYHNRPEENKLVFFEVGGYKWLRTGDYGRLDNEYYLFLLDRIKDLIKYKGHSVYPREIEELLYEHPAIQECAVIGVPDPMKGEDIKAFIILKKESKGKVTEQDIIDFAKENLAAYKYPREVQFVRSLPKSGVGKILRRTLREKEKKKRTKK